MYSVLDELAKKKVQNRLALRFGSFGWSGGAQADLDDVMNRLKTGWIFEAPVEFLGSPKEEHLQQLAERCRQLAMKIKELT